MADRAKMALRLPADVVAVMRRDMGGVAEQVIAAVISEVPSYRDPFRGQMGRKGTNVAGMRAIGFVGASHAGPGLADALSEAGAHRIIREMVELPNIVAALR